MRDKPRILLLGAYGQNNIGDEALLRVFLQQLGPAQFVVNSAQPEQTQRQYADFNIEAIPTYTRWPPRFRRVRKILSADVIVFGGGSLLKELEGSAFSRVMYLLRIVLIVVIARLLHKQSLMIGVGMGPLKHPLYSFLSQVIARFTTEICVRDQASLDLLKQIGVTRPVHLTADTVFSLKAEAKPVPEFVTAQPTETQAARQTAVVIPRYSLSIAEQRSFAQACDHLVEKHGLHVVMLPFQSGYESKYDDGVAAKAILGMMQHRANAELYETLDPEAALSVIGGATIVVSVRLHALIFAAIQSVPMVAISYEPKIKGFMDDFGQGSACLPLAQQTAPALIAKIDAVMEHHAAIKTAIATQIAVTRAKSLENFAIAHAAMQQTSVPASGKIAISASAFFFISATIVNAGNYLYNLIFGRWLGPVQFADLSLIVTLLLVITFVTSTLSTTLARFSAIYTAADNQAGLVALSKWAHRWAWIIGTGLMIIGVLSSPALASFFNAASPVPFMILSVGLPFYIVQAIDRGMLQGQTRFNRLSLSYQAEMWVRLAVGIVLVALGFAVNGATVGITLSLIATWLVARTATPKVASADDRQLSPSERQAIIVYAGPVLVGLISQILINNSDVLIVRRFFTPEQAGQYAALALIGRMVFFATWSVVTVMFPIVAQRHERGENHRPLLWGGMGLVGVVSGGILLATIIAPDLIVSILFGSAYAAIAPLLSLYALATALYALSNVVINYRLSTGKGDGTWFVLVASLAQVIGLWVWHPTLTDVVLIQIVIMAALLVSLLIWDALLERQQRGAAQPIKANVPPATT